MRKNPYIIILAMMIAIFHTSCDELMELVPLSSDDELQLSQSELLFESQASTATVAITSNCDWSLDNDSEQWCTIDTSFGNGDSSINISVTENDTEVDRQAAIVISTGSVTATLTVIQYAEVVTNYQEIDWDNVTISNYDPGSGDLQFILPDGVETDYTIGKAIILPEGYSYEVRVIESVAMSGNTATLSTSQGNMCNLFKNIDFVLMTNEVQAATVSRADGKRVITPSEISVQMTDGRYETIYQKSEVATRADYNLSASVISLTADYSDTYLLYGSNHSIGYEKLYYNLGLDAVFEFSFGETFSNVYEFLGALNDFKFYMDGNINIDVLMKYIFKGEYSTEGDDDDDDDDNCIKEDIIGQIKLSFVIPGANVPVVIYITTDLCKIAKVEAEIEASFTAGFYLNSNAQFGLHYDGSKTEPLKSFSLDYGLYDPTFSIDEGKIEATASIYPRFSFMIYSALGPWVEPMPYAKAEINAGMVESLDLGYVEATENYIGWSAEAYTGMMYRAGLNLEIFEFSKDIYESEIFEASHNTLFEAPTKVEIVSPTSEDELEFVEGEEVVVSLRTYSHNYITDEDMLCAGVYVMFETEGEVSSSALFSDINGEVEVTWTPQSATDLLRAVIVDSEGEVICEDELALKVDDRAILEQIYHATGGDNWTNNTNWCTDAPLDEWYGVTAYVDDETQREFVTHIELDNNNLSGDLDVSALSSLSYLTCNDNYLTTINASPLSNLSSSDYGSDQPTTSDASALGSLSCSNNQLTTLDVSGCSSLRSLTCYENSLTTLDVSGCSSLGYLTCYENSLTTLDVSGCSSLSYLYCYDNSLTTLDVSGFSNLWILDCRNNSLTVLDVSGCSRLGYLRCYTNQLTTLDVSECSSLEYLDCSTNQLTVLNVSEFSSLGYLYCYDNQLTTLDVSMCISLSNLRCFDNQLTTLELSGCSSLSSLWCYENSLTTLDVSGCSSSLSTLRCDDNQLTALDVSGFSSLDVLNCDENQLTTLDVSGCSILRTLSCDVNQLTTLNVREFSSLSVLSCSSNFLTTLDVSNLTGLSLLYCDSNLLTSLNVSGCSSLSWLHCEDNQLTTLDVSGCSGLERLYCEDNYLIAIYLYSIPSTTFTFTSWGDYDEELYIEPTHKNYYQYPEFYYK